MTSETTGLDGLPFTGLNMLWLLLTAATLLGAGTALRRFVGHR